MMQASKNGRKEGKMEGWQNTGEPVLIMPEFRSKDAGYSQH